MRRSQELWAAAIGGVFLVGVLGAVRLTSNPVIHGADQPFLFDDFDYGVTQCRKVVSYPIREGRALWALECQVVNHARRVDHAFDPSVIKAYGGGMRLWHEPVLEQAVFAAHPELNPSGTLSPGQTGRFTVLFVGPEQIDPVKVKFSFGGKAGEIMDRLLTGNRFVIFSPKGTL